MDRGQLLDRVECAWSAFVTACDGLPDAAMAEPSVVGDWSVQDLLSHIAIWEDEALKALPLLIDGKRPPRYNGIDGFNARQIALRRNLTLVQARASFEDTHRRLLAYLHDVPQSHYETETRFRHRLRLDTYGHYPEHTEAILVWRKERGL
jgi:uncharacterized protein (TIGR03083 family)